MVSLLSIPRRHIIYYLIAFSMPSLNSAFPFLEAICPPHDPTWHIRRGQHLVRYESVWLMSQESPDSPAPVTLVSMGQRLLTDAGCLDEERGFFLLCLVPREWPVDGLCDQLLRVCTSITSQNPGHIISQAKFYEYR
jgi:hypothetical protein